MNAEESNHDDFEPTWFKSSYSGGAGGECVEVAAAGPGVVRVRDSKDTSVPGLAVGACAWTRFIAFASRTDG